ncbi:MAG: hypothetical protein IH991_15710 [Planctomycetes bacterium]|nr:hypothetical protein [Planctomycetota bacterium]
MVNRDLRRRRDAANTRNRAEWKAIKNRKDWGAYRDVRLQRLRTSLGRLMATGKPPEKLNVKVTGTVKGDGFRIENVLYESRPGDWVPGNLYIPAKPRKSMPGILITHAHHRPKHQSELQDMGMTWARAGCLVLVIDQVGYGERRAHPFNGKSDYSKDYRWWRQDYYYRFDTNAQLHLVGESLMGWLVWDLMRGVDLLQSWAVSPAARDARGSLVRVLWGGTERKGTARLQRADWKGSLSVSAGSMELLESVNFQAVDDEARTVTPTRIEWSNQSAGNAAGIVVRVVGDDTTRLRFETAAKQIEFGLSEVCHDVLTFDAGGLNRFVRIGPPPDNDGPREFEATLSDTEPAAGCTPYWIRVTQVDQAMAWSSPVFVSRKH